MKHYGIMFTQEMIKAYLQGEKTETRRLKGLKRINENPDQWTLAGLSMTTVGPKFRFRNSTSLEFLTPPYGWLLDMLYFKETYAIICREAIPFCTCKTDEDVERNHYVEYKADTGNKYPGEWPEEEARGCDECPKWRSPMMMKRVYSRISVPIMGVKVQRLQDITEDDAIHEGVMENEYKGGNLLTMAETRFIHDKGAYVHRYMLLWNSINANKGMTWDFNPWVWVYSFPRYERKP